MSLEVSPLLAADAAASVAEARRLWRALARENAMVKIPGTPGAIPAIRALVAEGVNVNVTLLSSRGIYRRVADAWLAAQPFHRLLAAIDERREAGAGAHA